MTIDISTLTDEQLIAIAEKLQWTSRNPAKIRGAVSLNLSAMRVRAAVQAKLNEIEPNESEEGVSFGMSEEAAAAYIQQTFGLVPRMAKRAVNRGIDRDEYHGRGYIVKVIDISENTFDIQVYAA